MLHVVACHFNPAGFQRPRDNFQRFRDALGQSLTVVEASYDGRFYCDPDLAIEADPDRHALWQKERLLNVAMGLLPNSADKIAWIDADLLFGNPDWASECEARLDECPVVQLFESVTSLGPDGDVFSTHVGRVAFDHGVRDSSFAIGRRPGFAWAARRDALGIDLLDDGFDGPAKRRGGLFDLDVVGGGDSSMLSAWTGRTNDWLLRNLTSSFRTSFTPWAVDAWRRVRGRLGYVSGNVRHLYHGTPKNRRYGSRVKSLRDGRFDPANDIALDDNGLWRWASDKPAMHAAVRRYFSRRDEDD